MATEVVELEQDQQQAVLMTVAWSVYVIVMRGNIMFVLTSVVFKLYNLIVFAVPY